MQRRLMRSLLSRRPSVAGAFLRSSFGMSTLASHASTIAIKAKNETAKVTDPFLQQIHKDHAELTKESFRLHNEMKEHFAENAVWKHAIIGKSAQGARFTDVDGNSYIDFMGGFGSAMLGHNNEILNSTLTKILSSGIYHIGSRPPIMKEASELVYETTGFDKCYFFHSGTEACHLALRVARAYTKRDTILMFNGPFWHGQSDSTLFYADNDGRTLPLSPGVPQRMAGDVRLLPPFGSDESLQALRDCGGEVAALILEPIPVRQAQSSSREFLQALRDIADEKGFVLIFDEVVSGFRMGLGGAQEYYGVKADLGTYGKTIAAGIPVGVLAGKEEIMAATGAITIGGTFCNNAMQLQAVISTIRYLQENRSWVYPSLRDNMSIFAKAVNDAVATMQLPMKWHQFESLIRFEFDPAFELQNPHVPQAFILALRLRGLYYLTFFRVGFGTIAHTPEVMEEAAKCVVDTLTDFHKAGIIPSVK